MGDIIIVISLTTILLLGLGLFYYKKRSPLQFIIPLIGIAVSFASIIISLLIGGWNGLGLGVLGFGVFIGSAIAFIVIAILSNMRDLNSHYNR